MSEVPRLRTNAKHGKKKKKHGGLVRLKTLAPVIEANDKSLQDAFDAYDDNLSGSIKIKKITSELKSMGLQKNDPRLTAFYERIAKYPGGEHTEISFKEFKTLIRGAEKLIIRALSGQLTIPDWEEFCSEVKEMFEGARSNEDGKVADYIPQLGKVDPTLYGISICTVDGQVFSCGDSRKDFCAQSCSKAITYCTILEDHGVEKVHQHIGREPSGKPFNKNFLNPTGLPHNPMINAGAIMACSLIRPDSAQYSKFDYCQQIWSRLAGGAKIGFNNPVYLSERETAVRNFCLAYMMKDSGAFAEGVDIKKTLELYFQMCSIEINCESMATIASSLANGGNCCFTDDQVYNEETVKYCLALMLSCGMYDYSGEWAFRIGLPAKSGVGGGIMVVVPGLMGICIYSPRLDARGNSVRGIDFFTRFVDRYNVHCFDSLAVSQKADDSKKKDPTQRKSSSNIAKLLFAVQKDDVYQISTLIHGGVGVNEQDIDGRTAAHIACSEGNVASLGTLIDYGADLTIKDRWGNTPKDDIILHDQMKLHDFLEQWEMTNHPDNASKAVEKTAQTQTLHRQTDLFESTNRKKLD